jgi:hypothetical protein
VLVSGLLGWVTRQRVVAQRHKKRIGCLSNECIIVSYHMDRVDKGGD